MTFEYKVVPAPTRGRKAKGVKTPADRFAHALEEVMNDLAAEGWEYLRTDTLPAEERQGLTGRTTVYQNMLVFRRALDTDDRASAPLTDRATPPAPRLEAPRAPAPNTAAPNTAAPATPAVEPDAKAAQKRSLDAMIAQELAAVRAPRLPSAGAAQELSDRRTGPTLPTLTASRKDVAAE